MSTMRIFIIGLLFAAFIVSINGGGSDSASGAKASNPDSGADSARKSKGKMPGKSEEEEPDGFHSPDDNRNRVLHASAPPDEKVLTESEIKWIEENVKDVEVKRPGTDSKGNDREEKSRR